MRGRLVQIHALQQQRPALAGKHGKASGRKRPLLHAPALVVLDDQARLHLLAGGQLEQRRTAQKRLETRNRLTHQKRLFLPVATHELGRAQTG